MPSAESWTFVSQLWTLRNEAKSVTVRMLSKSSAYRVMQAELEGRSVKVVLGAGGRTIELDEGGLFEFPLLVAADVRAETESAGSWRASKADEGR